MIHSTTSSNVNIEYPLTDKKHWLALIDKCNFTVMKQWEIVYQSAPTQSRFANMAVNTKPDYFIADTTIEMIDSVFRV